MSQSLVQASTSAVGRIAPRRSHDRQEYSLAEAIGWRAWIRLWTERARERRALDKLDEHLLQDIGVSREEAVREAAKPFWH